MMDTLVQLMDSLTGYSQAAADLGIGEPCVPQAGDLGCTSIGVIRDLASGASLDGAHDNSIA